jgi:hypothetical protein
VLDGSLLPPAQTGDAGAIGKKAEAQGRNSLDDEDLVSRAD